MKQLDLFELEKINPAPVRSITSILSIPNYVPHDNDKFLSTEQLRLGLRTGNPPYPGYYSGLTAHNPPVSNLHGITGFNFTKFWNGFKWVHPEGVDVPFNMMVVWASNIDISQPILPPSTNWSRYADREDFVNSSDIKPPFPGVFYATDSEHKTMKYMRAFDGKSWSIRTMKKNQSDTGNMYWNVRRIPTREDIIKYTDEHKKEYR